MGGTRVRCGRRRGGGDVGRGFTLIELLVVVAVIALLVGMLLPALSKSRASARSVVCMSNQRQMGVGVEVFRHEHDQVMPWCDFTVWAAVEDPYFWVCGRFALYWALADAIDAPRAVGDIELQMAWEVSDVFKCPEDTADDVKPYIPPYAAAVWQTHCSSYEYLTGARMRWTMNERGCSSEEAAVVVSRAVSKYSRDVVMVDMLDWHGRGQGSAGQHMVTAKNALFVDGSVGKFEGLPEEQEEAIRAVTGAVDVEEEEDGEGA